MRTDPHSAARPDSISATREAARARRAVAPASTSRWRLRAAATIAAVLAVGAMLLPQAAASGDRIHTSQPLTSPLPTPDTPSTSPVPDGPNPDQLASVPTPYTSAELYPAGHADTAGSVGAGLIGRPSGPEVQPCRGLPRPQEIECLLTSGAGR